MKPTVILDDDRTAARIALENSPIVLEMQVDDVSDDPDPSSQMRALSWAIVAIAAHYADPAAVVRAFAEQLPVDLEAVLSGVRGGDDVQDRCTTSDSWGRQRERDLWPH